MTKKTRYTPKTLMQAIHDRVVTEGCYAEAETIMDYFSAGAIAGDTPFTSYEFTVVAYPYFGGSEGIYLDVVAQGVIDSSRERKCCHIGTYKPLREDLDAMQMMGRLGGSIAYYSFQFINEHLDDFEP